MRVCVWVWVSAHNSCCACLTLQFALHHSLSLSHSCLAFLTGKQVEGVGAIFVICAVAQNANDNWNLLWLLRPPCAKCHVQRTMCNDRWHFATSAPHHALSHSLSLSLSRTLSECNLATLQNVIPNLKLQLQLRRARLQNELCARHSATFRGMLCIV